ncbi:hypothetical protein [Flavobacterium sp.]|uniref:hypothetical protein n=1 Tax=Flavobacterium sp. TaxID=239 RepID=UPI00121D5F26|nr:hypothetical protein [Flavobacterium sp.]RZJ70244.1 MAG: hypothetical protein EOO49_14770 [Flavobacterium sp.]
MSQKRVSGEKAVSGKFFSFPNFWGCQVAFLVRAARAFLLLLRPGESSPRRTGDERNSKQATAQPAKNPKRAQLVLCGSRVKGFGFTENNKGKRFCDKRK